MKKLFFLSLSAIIFCCPSLVFPQSMPTPNVPQGCQDKPWPAKGHWAMLLEGQYGAESINKLEKGHKWKVAKRVKNEIIPIWCGYFDVPATSEQFNGMYATGNEKFVPIPIRDSGTFETTGFWIYK